MTHIELNYDEESTYVFTVTLDFTPTTMTWTWTDEDGTAINSRTAVAVSSPSTSNTITLTGDDLAIANPRKTKRVLLVQGTYNSGANKFAAEASVNGNELTNVT